MPTLSRCLQDYDLGFLRIIAEAAGLDPPHFARDELAAWLIEAFLEPGALDEHVDALPDEARAALERLLMHAGRMPVADFTREFGVMRELGPARRDREQPWRSPVSATETLWYHGLIGRAFLDSPQGPREFVYIPDELFQALGAPDPEHMPVMGGLARRPRLARAASSAIVDDATTLLAFHRRQPAAETIREIPPGHLCHPRSARLLESLFLDMGILAADSKSLDLDAARAFLELTRSDALRRLLHAWRDSRTWNDLAECDRLLPGKDGWPNDPLQSRGALLAILEAIPPDEWWDLQSLHDDLRRRMPAFQRPAGSFDTWYLRDSEGDMLDGLEHWDRVEGRLIRFVLLDVLHWLGVVDLGLLGDGGEAFAFRFNPASALLFGRSAEIEIREAEGRIHIDGSGVLRFSRGADRATRYQVARFARWLDSGEDEYRYVLTPGSLARAARQGLQLRQIKLLLTETGAKVPPPLRTALDRWETQGEEAHIERLTVLRTSTPQVLEELCSQRGVKRYIKTVLGPTAALVSEGDVPRLIAAAARAGILISAPPRPPG